MRCYRILGETILSFFFIVPRRRINRVYLLPASRQLRFQNDVSHHYMNVYTYIYHYILSNLPCDTDTAHDLKSTYPTNMAITYKYLRYINKAVYILYI